MGVGPRYDGGAGGTGGGGRDFGGGRGDGAGDAEALLRARLRLADEQIETPPGLWGRIRESGPAPAPSVVALPRRRPYTVALVVAATVAAVALGVWWLVRPGPVSVQPAGPSRTVKITVYNSEQACRTGRSLECALRLAKDPRAQYAARGNAARPGLARRRPGRALCGDRRPDGPRRSGHHVHPLVSGHQRAGGAGMAAGGADTEHPGGAGVC